LAFAKDFSKVARIMKIILSILTTFGKPLCLPDRMEIIMEIKLEIIVEIIVEIMK
jgi:hypothetical protein